MPLVDRPALYRACALVTAAGVAGVGANVVRPGGVALRSFEAPTACTAEVGASPRPAVVELPPREAATLCGREGVVFADTRPAARFEDGHVAGAVHLPCDATEAGAQTVIGSLSSAALVIVYGDSSDDGRAVAETLQRRGLRAELRVLHGGFAAWESDGLACASGPSQNRSVAGSPAGSPAGSTEASP
jgi:rhodanese-related sulfurtransferase